MNTKCYSSFVNQNKAFIILELSTIAGREYPAACLLQCATLKFLVRWQLVSLKESDKVDFSFTEAPI